MRPLLRRGVLCLSVAIAVIAACSNDAATTAATFTLALTIEGAGRVVSDPAGIDCTGPKYCGAQTYANSVVSTDSIVNGTTGATVQVNVLFVEGSQAADGGEDASPVYNAYEGGLPPAPAMPCTTPDGCGASEVRCVRYTTYAPPVTAMHCETAAACRLDYGTPLCTSLHDPRCADFNRICALGDDASVGTCDISLPK